MSYNSTQYDKQYYKSHCGNCYERGNGWEEIFARQASRIVKELSPHKVLDVGCAFGYLVEGLRDLGVDAYGIDISDYAISKVREDIKTYCKVKSATDCIEEKYDLITCIEVVEHLSPSDYKTVIENICNVTDMVIFSSTPFDFNEESHVSVNPVSFWVEQFMYNGFYHDINYDCSYIAVQTMLFRRGKKNNIDLVREYENKLFNMWMENRTLRDSVNISNARIADLDRGNIEHAQEMGKIKWEIDGNKQELEKYKQEVEENRQKLEENKLEIEKYKQEAYIEKEAANECRQKYSIICQKFEILENKYTNLNDRYKKILQHEAEINEINEIKIINLREIENNLKKEKENLERYIMGLQTEINKLKKEKENLTRKELRLEEVERKFAFLWKIYFDLKTYCVNNNLIKIVSKMKKKPVMEFGWVKDRIHYDLVFDEDCYSKCNPDISEVFGNDKVKLFEHFINFGMKEKRKSSYAFDVDQYRKYNSDIAEILGNDWEKYYLHYLQYGYFESRKCI